MESPSANRPGARCKRPLSKSGLACRSRLGWCSLNGFSRPLRTEDKEEIALARRRDDGRRKTIRRRDRKGLAMAVGGVLFLLACAAGYRSLLGPTPSYSIGGPFTLVDGQGQQRTDSSFRGRYMLIFFGYTSCTDVCPQTLTEMSEALDRMDPGARRIQPLFITVDPKNDTPARLRKYTAGFSPNLIGLTGTADQLGDVERLFHVVVEPDSVGGKDDFDHSAVIYLLGPDGKFIVPIAADANRTVLQSALRRYVPGPSVDRS